MASCKENLPQEGTGSEAVGESLSVSSETFCPSYSGGGTNCHGDSVPQSKKEVRVLLSRCDVESPVGIMSDSDSEMSCRTANSRRSSRASSLEGRMWQRKRTREFSSCDDEETLPSPKERKGRGRGRPPTTGHYVGLAQAKADANAANAEGLRLQAEKEMMEDLKRKRETVAATFRKTPSCSPANRDNVVDQPPDLAKVVSDSLDTIDKVAKSSGNLKGTYVKALNEAMAAIKTSMDELQSRTMSEEVARLKGENARLAHEMQVLRREMAEWRTAQCTPALPPPPAPPVVQEQPGFDELMRAVMLQVGTLVSARFDGLQDRLLPEKRLRPPLAADRKREEREKEAASLEADLPAPDLPAPAPQKIPEKGKGKGKKSKAKGKPAATSAGPSTRLKTPAPPPSPPSEAPQQPWIEVVRKGARKTVREPKPPPKTAAAPARSQNARSAPRNQPAKLAPKVQQQQQPKKRKAGRRRPPNTAAVVISLLPGATEKGLSYAKVLAEARARTNLESLGVPPLKIREAASGARILEVPGEEREGKANILADKLREIFSETEDVRVSRPTVTADLRVSGLDDATTAAELLCALASAGACDASVFKVGDIKRAAAGMGAAFVRCPLIVAKKIAGNNGRLLVGWVAAQVRLLDARPRRCHRCLLVGHVRAQCTEEVDRSEDCHRCGQKGHKAATCDAIPHCTLCAAAGKTANHLIGGKACAKSPTTSRRRRKGPGAKVKPRPLRPETSGETERMEES